MSSQQDLNSSIFGPPAGQQSLPPSSSPASKTPSKHNSLKLRIQQRCAASTTSAGLSPAAGSPPSAQSTPSKSLTRLDLNVTSTKASSTSNTTAAPHVPPKVSLFANYGKKNTQEDETEEGRLPLFDDESLNHPSSRDHPKAPRSREARGTPKRKRSCPMLRHPIAHLHQSTSLVAPMLMIQ